MAYSLFDQTMADMAWPDIEAAAEKGALVLLPTGVVEEHGPHMNLGVDIYCSYLLCRKVKEALAQRQVEVLICPPYYWGINTATGSFPGSFTVRKQTMIDLLLDILASLKTWGFTQVFNINWHGDEQHVLAILDAFAMARRQSEIDARCIVTPFEVKRFKLSHSDDHLLIFTDTPELAPRSEYIDIHAGSMETAIMSAFFPGDVDTKMAKQLTPTTLKPADLAKWADNARKETPLGYLGDPAGFEPNEGENLIRQMTAGLSELIQGVLPDH